MSAEEDLPSLISPADESSDCQTSHSCVRGTQTLVSTRKLANALWGMNKNKISSSQTLAVLHEKVLKKERIMMSSRRSGSLSWRLSDPSHTSGSKIPRHGSRRRMKCQIYDKSWCTRRKDVEPDLQSSSRLMMRNSGIFAWHSQVDHVVHRIANDTTDICDALQANKCCRGLTSASVVGGSGESRLKDLSNCLTASRELLKAIIHVLGPRERRSSAISLVLAVRAEIHHASEHLECLMAEKGSNCCETVCQKKCFSEQKEMLNLEEERRIRCLNQPIIKELESEKIRRKRTEMINKELGIEFTKLKDSLMKTSQELENEKRSREVAEKMCSDLSREYGERKAAVEELKRQFVKVRGELEEEREMLQIADEWREERVQMKIYEAKLEFEEKSAVVNQLRNELEAFLNAKRTEEPEVDEDEESRNSDLHSIELNIKRDNEIGTRLNSPAEEGRESNYGERAVRDGEHYINELWEHMLSDSKDAIAQCLVPEEDEACEEETNVAEMAKATRERANGEIVKKGGQMFQPQVQIPSM